MSRARTLIEHMCAVFVHVEALDPAEREEVFAAVLAHIRARDPVAVSPLAHGFVPTVPICDPREVKP